MKSKLLHSLNSLPIGLGLLAAGCAVPSAQAVTYYWDENGDTAGYGTAGNSGTNWSSTTSLFTTSATGVSAPTGTQATNTSDQATFGADTATNGLGGGTVNVSGTVDVGTIRLGRGTGQGAVTLSGGTINFAATGTIVGASSILTINSALTGAGTTLNLTANNGAGGSNLGGGYTGGGTLTISGSSTTNLTAGSYTVAAVTSTNSNGRNLNLNGSSTLLSAGNIFASGVAGNLGFDGGTLKSNNAAGITVFDNNNSIPVGAGGATFDTTVGNITFNSAVGVTGTGRLTFKGISGNTFTANTLALGTTTPTLGFNLGSVTINNSVALVSLTSLNETLDGGSYNVDFSGFNFNALGTYKLAGFTSISGTFASTDFVAANSTFGSGLTGGFVLDGSSLSYVVTSAIPEPSTFAAFAGLLALGFAATRRRSV
jgi:hypothetical protein